MTGKDKQDPTESTPAATVGGAPVAKKAARATKAAVKAAGRAAGRAGKAAELAAAAATRAADAAVTVAGAAVTEAVAADSTPPPATPGADAHALDLLVGGAHHNPHELLGAHATADGRTVIRTLRPNADAARVLVDGDTVVMEPVHPAGVWGVVVPGDPRDYRISVTYGDETFTMDDPYRWLPSLGEMDTYLIGEGRHENLWDVLGAHLHTYETPGGAEPSVTGVAFAVWAPSARGVRVAGEFNWWNGAALPMRSLGSSGIWELFVPGVGEGATYKYEILGADSVWRDKADPMAFATEVPPATASVVSVDHYDWQDSEWLDRRATTRWHAAPMSVYEIHIGSWREGLSYRELADELVAYLDETGFTHVEFLPVAEHPFGGSWGYQVSSYYAPSSRFGSPDDFRYLVDRLHRAGYGVIVDWVPAHFPKDAFALARFDGTPLYEHADPRRGEQPDWGTYVFDFGRTEVRNFLVANALFWFEKFHIDGLRVDAVASMLYLDYSRKEGEWLPNIYGGRENLDAVAFLQEMNATVYKRVPGVMTIAEESTSWPGVTRPTHLGGLGFGFKWNMGWMHDTLDYIAKEPVHRQWHHGEMTFSMVYAYSENFVLPISHDEVVHGKGSLLNKIPGDRWQQMATLRALYAYMWAFPGKQLLFMGQEFGQGAEWSESHSLDWWLLDSPDHRGVQRLISDLNRVYKETNALWSQDIVPAGFHWIDANDAAGNTFSFLRFGDDGSIVACVANFSPVPHEFYRLGLPKAGRWDEVVNTDAEAYFGSGVGNFGGVEATGESWHGQPASATIRVPPLGAVLFRFAG